MLALRFRKTVWYALAVTVLIGGRVAAQPKKPPMPPRKPPTAPAIRFANDPVEEMRLALRIPVKNPNNPDDLEFRRANLARHLNNLRTLSDLGQVLMLQEWHVEDQDERVAAINQAVRGEVVQRFETAARNLLKNGGPRTRAATAYLIGDLGVEVRGIYSNWGGAMRPLTPDLVAVARDPSVAVRVAVMTALGKINPDADLAIPALADVLATDEAPVRKAAATALVELIKRASLLSKNQNVGTVLLYRRDLFDAAAFTVSNSDQLRTSFAGFGYFAGLLTRGPAATEVVVTREELLALALAVVPVAGRGELDPEAAVRRSCQDALYQVGLAMAEQVADPHNRIDFPPEGRKPTPREQVEIAEYKAQVASERMDLLPLGRALGRLAYSFRRAFVDRDNEVRLQSRKTMIEIGFVRVKLERRIASIPPFNTSAIPADEDPILELYKEVLPALDLGIRDPNQVIRIDTVEALEVLGGDAVMAMPTLERATFDRNVFVRWAAVRSLSRIPPDKGESAVPLLIRELRDVDVDVRMMAVGALERYGLVARAALPELQRLLTVERDPDVRKAAIAVIVSMGSEAAVPAIPSLIQALGDSADLVRRAAAEALGRFGPTAKSALPALNRMQESDDVEDQKAATNAILRIVPAPAK